MLLTHKVAEPIRNRVDDIKLMSHYVKHLARSMRLDTESPTYKNKLTELEDFESSDLVDDLREVVSRNHMTRDIYSELDLSNTTLPQARIILKTMLPEL